MSGPVIPSGSLTLSVPFKIDLYNTKPNLYGELLEKWYYPPIEVKCLIERGVITNTDTEFGVDVNQTLTVTVSKTEFEGAEDA